MKFKILSLALIAFIGVQAQDTVKVEKPKDKIVETTTRIIKVMEDGKMVEKKIMVRTTQEQTVETDPSYAGTIDAPRVFPDTKVSKVIYIDNDNDPLYDEESNVSFYKEGAGYNFERTNSGYKIINAKTSDPYGSLRFSNNSDVYLLTTDDFNGIGYFEDGMFTVEYYNKDGILVVEHFRADKM
ncbi:hypothetical protein [Winogradskyella ursingii]|uniref:hypothetical protein n=1 Tax=Winogradskyella ursingii TaxID=2686079 RepID=UPI0015C89BB5|nr:hypothetical protein [Winogradskyella ursingii]